MFNDYQQSKCYQQTEFDSQKKLFSTKNFEKKMNQIHTEFCPIPSYLNKTYRPCDDHCCWRQ